MKAIQILAFGDVGGLAVVEVPQPASTPETAIVRVEAASINPSDANGSFSARLQWRPAWRSGQGGRRHPPHREPGGNPTAAAAWERRRSCGGAE
jgi:hypothetical protein